MFQNNWLSKNVRSIIAFNVVMMALFTDIFVLFVPIKIEDKQLANNIVTSLHGALMFVLGFFFSANHNPNKQDEVTTSTTETQTTTEKQIEKNQ